MTREHFWPLWLIDHANVHEDGVRWTTGTLIHPKNTTLPLCEECNNRLGNEIESPVSRILAKIETGGGICNSEAEFLVRWLWKFEGLAACYAHAGDPTWKYSDRWTLIDRVLGNALDELRGNLTLAIGLTNSNDPGYADWPMGIDSGVSELNATFVSGVFGRTAIMVLLSDFDYMVPGYFGLYHLQEQQDANDAVCFVPPICFPSCRDAVTITEAISEQLLRVHEEMVRRQQESRHIIPTWSRLIIPD